MTASPDMPLVERFDAALIAAIRRVLALAGWRREDVPAGTRGGAKTRTHAIEDDDRPVSPIRHWRWE